MKELTDEQIYDLNNTECAWHDWKEHEEWFEATLLPHAGEPETLEVLEERLEFFNHLWNEYSYEFARIKAVRYEVMIRRKRARALNKKVD